MTREESLGSSLALDPLPYCVVRMSGTLKNENKMDDSAAFKRTLALLENSLTSLIWVAHLLFPTECSSQREQNDAATRSCLPKRRFLRNSTTDKIH